MILNKIKNFKSLQMVTTMYRKYNYKDKFKIWNLNYEKEQMKS